MRKTRAVSLWAFLAGAVLAVYGCGGGGNGGGEPPAVDVSGIWSVDWFEDGGMSGTATADLAMDPDGTITGTYDPDYGGPVVATGSLYGYDLTLTVVETSPLDRTITLLATVNAAGTSATGTWSDTVGNTGTWDAAKP